ncbi:cytidylate kinase [Spizellomyces punctatus DAOM BR117]|uniref:(d)CMP kinase n=1 Tax=Spizellomyces punctatus (strain DAOM BR117) TaxID=645134 RepID=A0A0L0HKB4_SPIPD|nr:cytidylate kinase [Spizellomyces punctatus DAOM BR117]KND01901.1 cytidylate kinase [Spizellomyces punctatus DAOM BR117]|eukprot:XP_016609940.1 cytidylate kinase [Spizellomyces punctatus DAOM BR117]
MLQPRLSVLGFRSPLFNANLFPVARVQYYSTSIKSFQVAIDGPAASGKSTTARAVASRLGFTYIDSGAMYRGLTLKAMAWNLDPTKDAQTITNMASQTNFAFRTPQLPVDQLDNARTAITHVYLDGVDVTDEIRLPMITRAVAPIAALPSVREVLCSKQRAIAEGKEGQPPPEEASADSEYAMFLQEKIELEKALFTATSEGDFAQVQSLKDQIKELGDLCAELAPKDVSPESQVPSGVVMDGRDIGTNVLKQAHLKIFFEADPLVRAKRRLEELQRKQSKGDLPDLETVLKEIEARDLSDRTREVGPLLKADDAVVVDSSNMSLEDQIQTTEDLVRRKMKETGFA